METKINLITRNLDEVVNQELLEKIICKRTLKIYWGTAPTGQIHIGYLVPLLKIADFLDAGCKVTILLADLHAFLDAMKSSIEQLELRTQCYELIIKELLTCLGVDTNQLEFVRGREYQLKPDYTMDVYKMNSVITTSIAKNAGAEVVKQSDNPVMTGLIYPTLQALDEVYLNVDAQFGGVDQRKIFMFARDYLPKIGYKKKMIHLLNPLVPGLSTKSKDDKDADQDTKMSSSDEKSKINILDTPKKIKTKINSAYCLEGDTTDNTVLVLLEKVVFPILNHIDKKFTIQKPEKFGGEIVVYDTFQQVFDDFKECKLHPVDLKLGITNMLVEFLEPVRKKFLQPDLLKILRKAYP